MITVNAEGHAIMSRMHKLGDEKRSVAILRPNDWEEWLPASNIDAARVMLQLYPVDEIVAAPKVAWLDTTDLLVAGFFVTARAGGLLDKAFACHTT